MQPLYLRIPCQHALRLLCLVLFAIFPVTVATAAIYIGTVSPTEQTSIANEYRPGSTVALELGSVPVASDTLQWLHDDQPIPAATTQKLTLPNLSAADAGNYRLRATNGTSATYSNTIVVNVLPATSTAVDPAFSSQLPADFSPGNPTAFAADGSFIVQSGSGSSLVTVRLAADGSLVTGFTYPTTAGTVLAGFSDGRLITANAPYLLAADGTALPFTLPASLDATQALSGAVIQSDGKFYLSQGTTIVRLLADGTLDASFSFPAVDANTTAATAIDLDTSDHLLVRERRRDPNPYNYPSSWDVIYRLTSSGMPDTSFAGQTSIFRYTTWFKVVPLADGRLFYWSAYHGYRSWKIFHADGSLDESWSGGVYVPYDLVVDRRNAVVYFIASDTTLRRYRITATGLEEDTAFYPGMSAFSSVSSFVSTPAGKLLLSTRTSTWEGHATSRLARLLTDLPRPLLPPTVGISTNTTTPKRGDTVTLTAMTSDAGPYAYQWLALDNQPLATATTSSTLAISNFAAADLGRYQLRVTGTFGSALSSVVELQLGSGTYNLPYLANLSGRAVPGSGENTLFAGFTTKVYAGARGVPLLLRGVGPGLKDLGVSNYLPNPALNLRDFSGLIVANNDNWGASPDRDTIRTDFSATGAFALADDSLDAALLKTSYNEQFTVQLSDQANAPGVGLLEIYRVPDDSVVGELTNLSFRARTGPGEAVAIAGFVIVDPQNFDRSARVLLRVVGPSLADHGIQHPLTDPVLTLYNAKGEIVAHNDDWSLSPATNPTAAADVAAAMKQVGAFDLPGDSKDAALLLDLPAGAYSLHATAADGQPASGSAQEGVVLLEIYLVR